MLSPIIPGWIKFATEVATQRGHYHTRSIANRKFLFFVHVRRALCRMHQNAKTEPAAASMPICSAASMTKSTNTKRDHIANVHTLNERDDEALTAVPQSDSIVFTFIAQGRRRNFAHRPRALNNHAISGSIYNCQVRLIHGRNSRTQNFQEYNDSAELLPTWDLLV